MRNKIIIFGALLAFGLSLAQTANCGTKGQKTGNILPRIEKSYDTALSAAKKDRKYVFLLFSGLDWCPPCKRLHSQIVNTEEFAEYADKNLHVVIVDVPKNGSPKNKNHRKLLQEYSVRSFPTLLIIDPNGEVVDTMVGLEVRTPRQMIARIESVK